MVAKTNYEIMTMSGL